MSFENLITTLNDCRPVEPISRLSTEIGPPPPFEGDVRDTGVVIMGALFKIGDMAEDYLLEQLARPCIAAALKGLEADCLAMVEPE